MLRIRHDNNRWIEEEEKIVKEFEEHFRNMFTIKGNKDWNKVMKDVPKIVTDNMNANLVKRVTKAKIKKDVFQLRAYKAPRPDSFNGIIY